ncbi:MAG: protein phosphatase 2C domain-containing protein [Pseudomonadota bacterium]
MAKQFLISNEKYAGDCIQGRRHYQEDDFGFDSSQPHDFLMVLADGMGGHKGGAFASSCVIKTFMETYHAVSGCVAERLEQALEKSNQQLALEVHSKPKLRGMGCTLVGVAISEAQIEWISVGDSPLWLYNNAGQLIRLNADHSMKPILQELIRLDELTPDEVAVHPDRNMLRSALVGAIIEMVDQSSAPLEPGARVLLASDGILSLSETEIADILGQSLSVNELVKKLLGAVENKGKQYQDNTTALVVEM